MRFSTLRPGLLEIRDGPADGGLGHAEGPGGGGEAIQFHHLGQAASCAGSQNKLMLGSIPLKWSLLFHHWDMARVRRSKMRSPILPPSSKPPPWGKPMQISVYTMTVDLSAHPANLSKLLEKGQRIPPPRNSIQRGWWPRAWRRICSRCSSRCS